MPHCLHSGAHVTARPSLLTFSLLGWVLLGSTGCIKNIATNALADALSGTGGTYSKDDDPELIADALPFALKTMESVLEAQPEHRGLLAATSAGFTQYSYGFLKEEAEDIEKKDKALAEHLRMRTKKLLHRGWGYAVRGLQLREPKVLELLQEKPNEALKKMTKEDVPLLYWAAASWGAEISMDIENLETIADLPKVELLLRRALELDETWDDGAIHDLLMTYELSRPDGGTDAQKAAKEHFDRSLELSKGTRLSTLVTWAESSSVKKQNRAEFDSLIKRVLSFPLDSAPDRKLANTIAQHQARRLQARADDLFL